VYYTDIANGDPRAVWTGLCASVFADGNIHHGQIRVRTSLLGQAQSVVVPFKPARLSNTAHSVLHSLAVAPRYSLPPRLHVRMGPPPVHASEHQWLEPPQAGGHLWHPPMAATPFFDPVNGAWVSDYVRAFLHETYMQDGCTHRAPLSVAAGSHHEPFDVQGRGVRYARICLEGQLPVGLHVLAALRQTTVAPV